MGWWKGDERQRERYKHSEAGFQLEMCCAGRCLRYLAGPLWLFCSVLQHISQFRLPTWSLVSIFPKICVLFTEKITSCLLSRDVQIRESQIMGSFSDSENSEKHSDLTGKFRTYSRKAADKEKTFFTLYKRTVEHCWAFTGTKNPTTWKSNNYLIRWIYLVSYLQVAHFCVNEVLLVN